VGIAAVLVVSGCAGTSAPPPDPLQRQPGQVFLYGTDGNTMNGVGDLITKTHPNAIDGMKGTVPLTQLTQAFKDRVLSIDPTLADFTYAAETYDAVVIVALATEIAGSTDSRAIADQINGVTVGGQTCDSIAFCMTLVKQGKDIQYKGISNQLGGFTDAGEPSASTYGILRFGSDNHIVNGLTQFVPAGNPGNATQAPPPAHGNNNGTSASPLHLGGLMSKTGDLALACKALFAAAKLGVKEVNDAGGVLGHPVQWTEADDETNPDVAKTAATHLIDDGAQVLIGAAASGLSLAALPIAMQAGVVLFSPSNTAATLSTVKDDGLYFRTAPPDNLQAAALADIIVRDGARKLAVIYRDDAYGDGLAQSTKQDLIQAGLTDADIILMPYDANPPKDKPVDFAATAQQVLQANPDGVLLVGYAETVDAVDALVGAGITSITR
jgi:ABC-type branched-subunit amino acid transport system substrate-binding protein